MPELPEVENVRMGLEKFVVGKSITAIEVLNIKTAQFNLKQIEQNLPFKIVAIERFGKLLVFKTSVTDLIFLVHLKMTGQLIFKEKNNDSVAGGGHTFSKADLDLPNRHTRLIFKLDSGDIFFNDLRKFGYVKSVDKINYQKSIEKIGIEPMSSFFTKEYLFEMFKNKKTSVKSILLSQNKLSGLGNIYVDEVCFVSKINPATQAGLIDKNKIIALHKNIKKIIFMAIKKGGTTFYSFRQATGKKGGYQDFLKVYKKQGMPCDFCGTKIQKIKVSGRGTHFCPDCQPV